MMKISGIYGIFITRVKRQFVFGVFKKVLRNTFLKFLKFFKIFLRFTRK